MTQNLILNKNLPECDNYWDCEALTRTDRYYDHLDWVSLPSSVQDACETIGFSELMWDYDLWHEIRHKEWKDIPEEKRKALQVIGYSEEVWKSVFVNSK